MLPLEICRHPLWSLAACLGSDALFYLAGLVTAPVILLIIWRRWVKGPGR